MSDTHQLLNQAFQLHQSGNRDEAVPLYAEVLQVEPENMEARRFIAECLVDLKRYEEARNVIRYAVTLRPYNAAAQYLLGTVESLIGNTDAAHRRFLSAISISPSFAPARWNLGLWQLSHGEYENGWANYEFGKVTGQRPTRHVASQWDGEPIPGKTLYIWIEQGLGDFIAFQRFVKIAKDRSQAHIVLEVPEQMARLFANHPHADQVVVKPREMCFNTTHFDHHCTLMSLPHVLKLHSFVALQTQTLAFDDIAPAEGLCHTQGLKVGMCWQGGKGDKHQSERSISPDALAPILGINSINYYSLQYQGEPVEGINSTSIRDFADIAALIKTMDIVVTIDTSVAHLAAAMGKPTWVLLPHNPYFVWSATDRESSVWYSHAKLFAQETPGDFTAQINRVRSLLRGLVGDVND